MNLSVSSKCVVSVTNALKFSFLWQWLSCPLVDVKPADHIIFAFLFCHPCITTVCKLHWLHLWHPTTVTLHLGAARHQTKPAAILTYINFHHTIVSSKTSVKLDCWPIVTKNRSVFYRFSPNPSGFARLSTFFDPQNLRKVRPKGCAAGSFLRMLWQQKETGRSHDHLPVPYRMRSTNALSYVMCLFNGKSTGL